jgi:hypothetical protein
MGKLIGILAGSSLLLCASSAWAQDESMRAFRTDKQLERYLERIGASRSASIPLPPPAPPPLYAPPMVSPPASVPTTVAPDGSLTVTGQPIAQPNLESASPVSVVSSDVIVTGSRIETPNITNTQELGVDEGGIVKVHGTLLVVLRRGRLFTVDTAEGALRRIDQINAFPGGDGDGSGAWYDEMLVSGDLVIVIGYSYARFGTEINRFRISADGKLTYLDTHLIRSDDYYSDRNYASRLIGTKLVVYSPIPISLGDTWQESLPAVRRWTGPGKDDDENSGFKRLTSAAQIFLPEPLWKARDVYLDTFHTVTTCDVAKIEFRCTGQAVLGTESRTFYVSQTAVYVWTDEIELRDQPGVTSFLYRLPLDGSDPQAIRAWGGPVDQFSFREDKREGMLNVVLRANSGGDKMWRPELNEGDAALLRIPLAAFGDGSSIAARRAYRDLPTGEDYGWQNRFVGRHLLYVSDDEQQGLRAVPLDGGPIRWVPLPHSVTRLDVIGADGVAIGQDKDEALGFSAIGLDPRSGNATLEDTYLFPGAEEGENRSQAFYYKPDASDPTGTSGVMALPINRELQGNGTRFLGSSSAIVFLNRMRRKLSPAGELGANADGAVEDHCIASCTDWYGNARPIFLGNRTFALMGYELVEGRLENGRIVEVKRLDFAPVARPLEKK